MLVFKGFKFQKTENVGSVLAVLPKFQRVQYIIWTLFFVLSWKHSELLRQIGKCAVICYYVFFSNLTGFSPEVATISYVPFLWEMSLNQTISWSMIVTQKRGRRGGGGNELGSEKAGENALMSRTSLDILEKPHNWQPGEGIICYRDLVTLKYFFSPGIQ